MRREAKKRLSFQLAFKPHGKARLSLLDFVDVAEELVYDITRRIESCRNAANCGMQLGRVNVRLGYRA